MNDEIQLFDDNFQVRFITFIFFNKEIYIFINKKKVGGASALGFGVEMEIHDHHWLNFNTNFYLKKFEL